MVKEFKKELSKICGIDFFGPKFRDLFKRYFPNEEEKAVDEEPKDEESPVDAIEEKAPVEEVVEEPTMEDAEEDSKDEEKDKEEVPAEEQAEEAKEEPVAADEDGEKEAKEPEVIEPTVEKEESLTKELLEAKIELELVKAGVRADRLKAAMKLLMGEIKSLDEISKVKELIKEYPEWLNSGKADAQPIGMSLDDSGDGLTAEERKLKAMGIDPKA